MPGIDGSEVLRLLKAAAATAQIPVIMISGLEDINVVVECVEYGAEDYLPKPCNLTLACAVGTSLDKNLGMTKIWLSMTFEGNPGQHQVTVDRGSETASELSSSDDNEVTLERLRHTLRPCLHCCWRKIPPCMRQSRS